MLESSLFLLLSILFHDLGNWEELQGWTIFFIHPMQISLALQTLRLLLQKIITGRVKAHCSSKNLHLFTYYLFSFLCGLAAFYIPCCWAYYPLSLTLFNLSFLLLSYRCVLTPGDPYMPLPNDEIIKRVSKQVSMSFQLETVIKKFSMIINWNSKS